MGKDKLEHNIKNKLSTYESAVNTDALWAGIQAGMAAPAAPTVVATSSSFLKTWGLGLAVAATIAVAAISYYSFNSSDEEIKDSSMNSSIPTSDRNLDSDKSLIKSSNLVNNEVSQNTISGSSGPDVSNDSETTSGANTERTLEGNLSADIAPVTQSNSSTNRTTVNNPTTSKNNAASAVNATTHSSSQGNNSNQVENSFGTENIPSSTQKPRSSSNSPANTQPKATNTIPLGLTQKEKAMDFAINQENTTTNAANSFSSTQNSSLKSNIAKAIVNSTALNTSTLQDLSYDSRIGLVQLELPNPPIECPSFGGKNSKRGGVFMLELQAIPYYSIPQITALNEVGQTWKQTKLDTESYLETFQVNLVARYQMNRGLYFNAGVGYGQLDEKLNFETMQTIVTQEELPVTIIIRPDGMNDTIPGQVEVTQDSFYVAETFNYHRMVEFTAAVGYEFPINPRLSLYGDVGLSVNLLTTRSGYHILDEIEVVSFDKESRPVYTTSTGYKMTGGLGLRYYAGNGVVLSGGPEFRSHLSNWIRDEHPIELRYLDIGVRAAVAYMF